MIFEIKNTTISTLNINFKTGCNINPLSANPTKCSNTLKQVVDNLPTNCLSLFDHFVRLAFKGLMNSQHLMNTAIPIRS